MEGTSQPTSPAGMSRLPIELFRKVTGYLAFFDKKAVQITSKKCHLLTGPFICPDILLWRLHCCRSGISCHRNSSLMSDIVELNSLTLKCLSRDTWIDVFQGREVRDAHLAFLDQWNSVNLRELPDGSHQRLMSLLSPGPTPMRWQQTLSQETRFALLHKMISHLCLLNPKWHLIRIFRVAIASERQKFWQARDRATYEDECRRGSSVYISPILQPYFNEAFPKSTVAHACFSLIFDIAQSGIDGQAGGPNDMRLREQLGDKAQWRRISEGAEASIQELDSWMHADGRIMMV